MNGYLTSTQSVCGVCRRPLPAQIFVESGAVRMRKHCPEHGPQERLISSDAEAYVRLPRFHRRAWKPRQFATEARGCPDSCGICPEHEQHVCLPIIEITDHCNWECPICLVRNPGRRHLTRAEVATMLDRLLASEGRIDILNLSGGEPTLNPDFRDIVEECVGRKDILRVSVSTNGSVLARDTALLRFLAERRVIVSLQFDGLDDSIYQALRGRPLLAEKLRLIDHCGELDASMSLTATVARGINAEAGALAPIADLLFRHHHIVSAMFQPATYTGNARTFPRPANPVTTPDVIAALHGAGGGTVAPADFSPLPCSHPACFSLAFYLQTGPGRHQPIKQLVGAERFLDLVSNRALFGTDEGSYACIADAVYDLWSGPAALSPDSEAALQTVRRLLLAAAPAGAYSPQGAVAVAERSVKSIFIHQFMDPDSFDLSRARKCCQVYPQPDGRDLPVCIRNCLGKEEP